MDVINPVYRNILYEVAPETLFHDKTIEPLVLVLGVIAIRIGEMGVWETYTVIIIEYTEVSRLLSTNVNVTVCYPVR